MSTRQLGKKSISLNDRGNQRNPDVINFYLAEDIIQGEEVPFFLLWKEMNVENIQLSMEGFSSILQLHNVRNIKESIAQKCIKGEDIKVPGYLGGILATKVGDEPYQNAELEITLISDNSEPLILTEARILHTTLIRIVEAPGIISTPNLSDEPPIKVELRGCTTLLLDIDTLKNSEIEFVLPDKIKNAFEKFFSLLEEGLKKLKEEYPNHGSLIDDILEGPGKKSERQYFDIVSSKMKDAIADRSFSEAVALVFANALLAHGVREAILLPLLEYLEGSVAEKTFFEAPFICAKVSSGGGKLVCQLSAENLLKKRCGKPLIIETTIQSDEDILIPIIELFDIRRV